MLEMDAEFTGERFVPGAGGSQIAGEHAHRYIAAAHLASGRRVLDLGCGTGYGSILLGDYKSYVGVDIDADSVAAASDAFGGPAAEFLVADVMATELETASFDVVVSFEVIEHVPEPAAVVREAKRLLRPGGLFVMSTPDKVTYNANRAEPNPFHPSELTEAELRALLSDNFANVRLFGQRFTTSSGIFDPGQQDAEGRIFLPEETFGSAPIPMYWVAVASDAELPEYPPSVMLLAEERDLGAELVTAVRQLGVYEEELAKRASALAAADQRNDDLARQVEELNLDNARLQRQYDYVSQKWAKWTLQKYRRRGTR